MWFCSLFTLQGVPSAEITSRELGTMGLTDNVLSELSAACSLREPSQSTRTLNYRLHKLVLEVANP